MAMSELVQVELPDKGLKARVTARRDWWWVPQALTFLGLSSFLAYGNWAAWQGNHYVYGPYLSPFYSPELWGNSPHAWFGSLPEWYPKFLPYSPALLILWIPGLFRLTCYYYRGAYYKAFWADPPGCTVAEPRKKYRGEHSFPLILQNIHRYFLFLSLAVLAILIYDALNAFWFEIPLAETGMGNTSAEFGIGVGSVVLLANCVLLSLYLLGCHSLRHLTGGRLDSLRGRPVRKSCYDCVSGLNKRHMLWAWCSLFSVGFADLYVRMCSMGIWTDVRLF